MLFNASKRPWSNIARRSSFNLVIEMLFNARIKHLLRLVSTSQFQSRNRDAFQCKLRLAARFCISFICFNLVIEMLFNARLIDRSRSRKVLLSFNLVIEMLFNASSLTDAEIETYFEFQSRNRDAFQCKWSGVSWSVSSKLRFNLVIEMLFNARASERLLRWFCCHSFNLVIEMLFNARGFIADASIRSQSCFNLVIEMLFNASLFYLWSRDCPILRFNLVIEMLFNARRCVWTQVARSYGFNLVIEMLFNASARPSNLPRKQFRFQSRNRDAFQCKFEREERWDSPKMFQSRNRDAFQCKRWAVVRMPDVNMGFNLVIEMLFNASLIRSHRKGAEQVYRFNLVIEMLFNARKWISPSLKIRQRCFNLVIEMLFNASNEFLKTAQTLACFNLVIEMLFNASRTRWSGHQQ